ncbi:MAG TPA: CoA-transferase [Chthoniobacteraceae bacterium]|nr:CoA-transferase [Chthoniobacteraceae bacterium]
MPEAVSLATAIKTLLRPGQSVALEGFTHLIPYAAGHEIIRQGLTGLTLIRMTPDLLYDQMIGMGCARKLIFSWGGNPGVGSLHRFRDAIENAWPRPLEIEEHSHAGMACGYEAGASGLPFGVLRGYVGTDLIRQHQRVRRIECPFTGEKLAAVPALRPDVAIVHAQRADRRGNVLFEGIVGVQKECLYAARRSLVTVEKIVDELTPSGRMATIVPASPAMTICEVPFGAVPSYAQGCYPRSNAFYIAWDGISRDRDRFRAWMEAHGIVPECRVEELSR